MQWNGKGYNSLNNIIYELNNGNGHIKQFWGNGKLNFEGEYLNGKRNGKGKEYDDDIIMYEGEYLNGMKHGRGKENNHKGFLYFDGEYLYNYKIKGKYYLKGNLEFEGEFLYDNKFNGKGYDQDGNIIYELINGNGKVKEYWVIGDILFEGEYLNGKKNGKGKECYFRNILLYEGEFLNEKRHGKGKEYDFKDKCSKLKYEGEYLN